jgi:glutathione S-transferase
MIKFYWCPQTRASRILWMLEEMGEPFEIEMGDLRKPETKSAEFAA